MLNTTRKALRALLVTATLALTSIPQAQAQPADQQIPHQGPQLSVLDEQLHAALHCEGNLSQGTPVLLVHGTTYTAATTWTAYEHAFSRAGRAYCTVDLPAMGTGDIQIATEYVVHAIRHMSAEAGASDGRIDIVGHSQGGMVPRWAMKYWPDTRQRVRNLVGLAPSNHGTDSSTGCARHGCVPAFWQQGSSSNFMRALNSDNETWPGVTYTNIITRNDLIVTPPTSGYLSDKPTSADPAPRVLNINLADRCPSDITGHLGMLISEPVYRIVTSVLDMESDALIGVATGEDAIGPGGPGSGGANGSGAVGSGAVGSVGSGGAQDGSAALGRSGGCGQVIEDVPWLIYPGAIVNGLYQPVKAMVVQPRVAQEPGLKEYAR